jgi:hypothetical protein
MFYVKNRGQKLCWQLWSVLGRKGAQNTKSDYI